VFFAIPLATLVHAILKAWSRHRSKETMEPVTQTTKNVT
jgi:predicted PurR-regulated permease PerM